METEGLLWLQLLERVAWHWCQVGVLGELAGAGYPLYLGHSAGKLKKQVMDGLWSSPHGGAGTCTVPST